MIRRPIIGIDLDDVCWNMLESWISRHNEITEDDVKLSDIKGWDIMNYIKKGSHGMMFYILEQLDFWETVQPKELSQFYLKKLIDDGYEIYIITATSYKTFHLKMKRFIDLFPFIDPKNVIVAHNKQLIDVDLLIDDNPENLRNGFYNKILFDAPHNKSTNEKELGAFRCSDWESVYKKIKKLLPIK